MDARKGGIFSNTHTYTHTLGETTETLRPLKSTDCSLLLLKRLRLVETTISRDSKSWKKLRAWETDASLMVLDARARRVYYLPLCRIGEKWLVPRSHRMFVDFCQASSLVSRINVVVRGINKSEFKCNVCSISILIFLLSFLDFIL